MKISIFEKDAKKRQCAAFGAPEQKDIDAIYSADSSTHRPCIGSACMNWRETSKTAGVCLLMLGHNVVAELFKAEIQSRPQQK